MIEVPFRTGNPCPICGRTVTFSARAIPGGIDKFAEGKEDFCISDMGVSKEIFLHE